MAKDFKCTQVRVLAGVPIVATTQCNAEEEIKFEFTFDFETVLKEEIEEEYTKKIEDQIKVAETAAQGAINAAKTAISTHKILINATKATLDIKKIANNSPILNSPALDDLFKKAKEEKEKEIKAFEDKLKGQEEQLTKLKGELTKLEEVLEQQRQTITNTLNVEKAAKMLTIPALIAVIVQSIKVNISIQESIVTNETRIIKKPLVQVLPAINPPNTQAKAILTFPEALAGASLQMTYAFEYQNPTKTRNINTLAGLQSNIDIVIRNADGDIIEEIEKDKVYWSEHEHAKWGAKLTVQKELWKNETGFLHIYTKGLFGKQVFIKYEGNGGTTKVLGSISQTTMRDNVVSVPYAMSKALADYKAKEPTFAGSEIKLQGFASKTNPMTGLKNTEELTLHCNQDATDPQQPTVGTDVKVNITTDEESPGETTKAKCILQFRPDNTYIGDYGFDWVRMGDTSVPSATQPAGHHHDYDFKNHMGKHYYHEHSAPQLYDFEERVYFVENTIEFNVNNHGNQFQKDIDSPQTRFLPKFNQLLPPDDEVFVVSSQPVVEHVKTPLSLTEATSPLTEAPSVTTTTPPTVAGGSTTQGVSTTTKTIGGLYDVGGATPAIGSTTTNKNETATKTATETTITTTTTVTTNFIYTTEGNNYEARTTSTITNTNILYPKTTDPQPANSTVYEQYKSTNEVDQTFGDGKMYRRLRHRYRRLVFDWDPTNATKNESETYTPIMTILNTRVADLVLHLDIKEEPKEILFEFDNATASNFLTLSNNKIDTNLGVTATTDKTTHTLKISCSGEFAQEYTLFARAFKKDTTDASGNVQTDTKGEICAMLRILPNAPQYHFKPKVVLIPCQTFLKGVNPVTGSMPANASLKLENILGQALVFPEIEILPNPFDLTQPADNFNSLYCQLKTAAVPAVPATPTTPAVPAVPAVYDTIDTKKIKEMKVFLLDKLKADYAGKYEHYYKIFLFEEEQNDNIIGYSYEEKYIICFKALSEDNGLVAHELLHGLKLQHPFDGVSKNTHFNYEFARTDNIMDYSADQYKGLNAKTLFHWQWQVINPKIR